MNRTFEALQLCYFSGGVLLIGLALCFLFVSFGPLIWAIGLIVFFLLYFATCLIGKRLTTEVAYVSIGFAYSVVFGCAITDFTGVEQVERYDCRWRLTDNQVEVDLGVVAGFSWSPVVSDKLIEHLRKDQPAKVRVDVSIIRDFGRVRARRMIQDVDGISVREPY